jgi:hypothetical protein
MGASHGSEILQLAAITLLNYAKLPTTLRETISPFAFLTFRNFIKKYQKRDFATTVLGAKILIRYSFGAGFASLGRWRPMTWYSVRRPNESSQLPSPDCVSSSWSKRVDRVWKGIVPSTTVAADISSCNFDEACPESLGDFR